MSERKQDSSRLILESSVFSQLELMKPISRVLANVNCEVTRRLPGLVPEQYKLPAHDPIVPSTSAPSVI